MKGRAAELGRNLVGRLPRPGSNPAIEVTVGIFPPHPHTFSSTDGKNFFFFIGGWSMSFDDFSPEVRCRFRPVLERKWLEEKTRREAQGDDSVARL